MATAKKSNVRSKLIEARKRFLEAGMKKSGKNFNLGFKYFELSDIVPIATPIFADLGLVHELDFTGDTARMTVFDADDSESAGITFSAPFIQLDPIVSNAGKEVTNRMQALGSSITYMRRYLYMMALDIVEADDIEPTITDSEPVKKETPKKEEPKRPATTEERKELKKEMTQDASASDEQITQLKTLLSNLLKADPAQEAFVQDVAMKTNGFTTVKADVCEQLIGYVGELLKEVSK